MKQQWPPGHHASQVALRRAMKAANMEPNGYGLTLCDSVQCRACKKAKNEKAPWNKPRG